MNKQDPEKLPDNNVKIISKFIIFLGATILQLYAFVELVQGHYFHLITFGIATFAASELSAPWNYKLYKKNFGKYIGGGGWGYYLKSPVLRYGIWAFIVSLPLFIFIFNWVKLYFI